MMFFPAGKKKKHTYREVYAADSTYRQWAVVLFLFNMTQNFASHMLSVVPDEKSRWDSVNTSLDVNAVALFMYAHFCKEGSGSWGGGAAVHLVASRRAGGGINTARYVMWTITTPSIIHQCVVRARKANGRGGAGAGGAGLGGGVEVNTSSFRSPSRAPSFSSVSEERHGEGAEGTTGAAAAALSAAEAWKARFQDEGVALSSAEAWKARFQDEGLASAASLAMYVTGFLGKKWRSLGEGGSREGVGVES